MDLVRVNSTTDLLSTQKNSDEFSQLLVQGISEVRLNSQLNTELWLEGNCRCLNIISLFKISRLVNIIDIEQV